MRVIGLLNLAPGAGVQTLAAGLKAKGRTQGRSIEVFDARPPANPVVTGARGQLQVAEQLGKLAQTLPGLQRANVEVLVVPDLMTWLTPWSLEGDGQDALSVAWAPVGLGKQARPTGLLWQVQEIVPSASLLPLIADARDRNERTVTHGRAVLHHLGVRPWAHPASLGTDHNAMIDHLLSGAWEVPLLREALGTGAQDQTAAPAPRVRL